MFFSFKVVAYQKKLQQLDGRQQELVRDNFELKDLCLYLDEERTNNPCYGEKLSCPECGHGPIWVIGRGPPSPNTTADSVEAKDCDISEKKEGDSSQSSDNSSSSSCQQNLQSEQSRTALEILTSFDEKLSFKDSDTLETEKAILREMFNVVQRTFDV